jgi:hypothetical protein
MIATTATAMTAATAATIVGVTVKKVLLE